MNIRRIEKKIADKVLKCGEQDGLCHIINFDDNMDGMCDILIEDFRHTDILSVYLTDDGQLAFLVATPNDVSKMFVSIREFTKKTIKEIYKHIIG